MIWHFQASEKIVDMKSSCIGFSSFTRSLGLQVKQEGSKISGKTSWWFVWIDSAKDIEQAMFNQFLWKYFAESKDPVLAIANRSDLSEVKQEYLLQLTNFHQTCYNGSLPVSSLDSKFRNFMKSPTILVEVVLCWQPELWFQARSLGFWGLSTKRHWPVLANRFF